MVPGWNFGWRHILKDEDVFDVLSWFLHYACQYVHRADVAKVLMVVWELHERVLHPFGSSANRYRYGPQIKMRSAKEALDHASVAFLKQIAEGDAQSIVPPAASGWIQRNTLDPMIHQGVFHYLRAQELRAHGFDMEAVVAFDCTLQSIGNFLQARLKSHGGLTRRRICEELSLSAEVAELAEYAYFLRNNFGAHAGGWRWWDQEELLEKDQLTGLAELAELALAAAADGEPAARLVEPCPSDWGEWLLSNFEMLWDAVWFEKFHSMYAARGSDG
jgi:hypothetical protein